MKSRWMLLIGSLGLLAGCGAQSGAAGEAAGKVTVLIKDAPADLKAAVVTIAEVDLVGSSGTLVLGTPNTTTNLLTLANDTATLVSGAVVPAGMYTQLRFVITGGYIETTDGAIYASSPSYEALPQGATVTGTLRMPSYAQSGLKIDLPDGGLTIAGQEKIVLVDFNVAQSFGHQAGSSGAWVMHPVCTATNIEVTGSLAVTLTLAPGVVLPANVGLGDFQAVLTPPAGGDIVTVPLADEGGGTFGVVFLYLAPGDYSLSFTAPAAIASFTIDPPIPATPTVTSDHQTTASFVLTGVTAAGGAPPPPSTP